MSNINVPQTFFLNPTDSDEVKKIFSEIHNKNASGCDELSVKVFKHLPDVALGILADAINNLFETGTFPSCLKMATVITLYKGGDADSPSNFRPISLLPTLAKIVEKLFRVS